MSKNKAKTVFPGFRACLEMMHNHNSQTQEDGFHLLFPHAGHYAKELIEELNKESDHGLKCWLLELIGEARAPQAMPLFQDYLRHEDESFRAWAVYGLRKLNTKEARRILWEARSYTFSSCAQ